MIPGTETLYGVTWHDADTLVISRGTDAGSRLFTIDLTTGAQGPIGGGAVQLNCDGTDDVSPTAISGGLAWLRICKRGAEPRNYSLMILSQRGDVSVGAAFETAFPVGDLAFDGTNWIADYGSRICNTLIRVTSDGLAPIHVTVQSPDGTFDTGLHVRDDCERMGVSRNPGVLNDRLAFMASTASISKTGTARLLQPSDLYIAPLAGGTADRVAVGLIDPSGVVWIDDTHIAISGELPATAFGTWTINVSSGEVVAVLPFAARSMSVSPDGATAAALRAVRGSPITDEVVIFPAELLKP